jgi:2-polyprenyl-3-methyl-5-hydroxy-6-metoxy-1,4-benzoquinol methylase
MVPARDPPPEPPVIARRELPLHFADWNRRWGAPHGRRGRLARLASRTSLARTRAGIRLVGPFAWQANNSTREFEYPWAYHHVAARAARLGPQTIVDVGGSLAGLQFVLAREGHRVLNVDPGLAARGKGWNVDADTFGRLCAAFHAPVELRPCTLGEAGIPDGSVDVLLSISTIEHFADEDLKEMAAHVRRVLKPDGIVLFTIDLFLDVAPFGRRSRNEFGRNIDVRALLDACGLALEEGVPSELLGFDDFDVPSIHDALPSLLVGRYPALAQCLVARAQPVATPATRGLPQVRSRDDAERETVRSSS